MGRNPDFHDPLPHSFAEVLGVIADENKPAIKEVVARPFLKWVGGKRSILPELLKRLPIEYDAYHEPFLGGGALFFALKPKEAFLYDINFYLVITFSAVRDNVDEVIKNLKVHAAKHDKEYYLKARTRLMREKDPAKLAALFIYINKTCFNGLYRVNKAGGFNVPMGDYKNPPILDESNLYACSDALKGAAISQQSFMHAKIYKDDFYYLDPPYHETYEGYASGGFGDDEHTKLAEFCRKIDKSGGYFMLSNSDTPFVRNLYRGYTIENVDASRSVSCKSHQRGKETELIIRNYT